MNCAWNAYLNLLPVRLRGPVNEIGSELLTEVRLRSGQQPELVCSEGSKWLDSVITCEDLHFVVNMGSQYSAWTSITASEGYITATGGHRIGLCGQAVTDGNRMTGIRTPTSVCIRVAKDILGIAREVAQLPGSTLILGRPGSGKTTFLRDLVRQISSIFHIAVVDERQEVFPQACGCCCFDSGKRTDIISGCDKATGVEAVVRAMNPDYVAIDEITADRDCKAVMHAGWCGVNILATAHAGNKYDFYTRPIYKPIIDANLFQNLVIIRPDRTYTVERI